MWLLWYMRWASLVQCPRDPCCVAYVFQRARTSTFLSYLS